MVILMTKLKNRLKEKGEYEYHLRNITINGDKRGCSGHIVNPVNGTVIYVNTEEPCLSNLHYMYRYAKDIKDYTGGHNRWADTLDELINGIVDCLNKTADPREFRW